MLSAKTAFCIPKCAEEAVWDAESLRFVPEFVRTCFARSGRMHSDQVSAAELRSCVLIAQVASPFVAAAEVQPAAAAGGFAAAAALPVEAAAAGPGPGTGGGDGDGAEQGMERQRSAEISAAADSGAQQAGGVPPSGPSGSSLRRPPSLQRRSAVIEEVRIQPSVFAHSHDTASAQAGFGGAAFLQMSGSMGAVLGSTDGA